nr:tape measure protein [uncultured Campylobacter sp.]
MTETASLIVSAKVEGADKLKSDLNTISNEAKKAENAAQGLASSFTGLKVAIAAVASSAMLREFVKVADDMSLVNSRLKMATSSAAEYAKQQKALHAIARDTHADIKETIDLYAKLAPALKNIGKSTEDTNNMVSSFTKALQLGGASAEEAAAAIKQFGQAMGSGALRGDEFNSIAEASPTLLRYMAEGLGVNVGKLRELGSEGKLTAEALSNAFEKVKGRIDSDFAQMPVTVGKAFTDLRTEINLIVGDINEATGATQTISGAIKGFADILKNNRDSILWWGEHLGKLALAIGITKAATVAVIPTIRAVVASFTAAASSAGVMTAALTTARTAVMGLKAAFMGFLPTLAIFAAVEAFFALKDSMDEAKPSADKLNDALSKTNEELQKLTRNQRDAINLDLKASLDANFRKIDEINRKLEEHNKFGGIVKAYRLEADEIVKLKAERDGYIAQNSKIIGQRKEIASINSGVGAIETQQQKDAAYINSLEKTTKDLHVTTLPMLKKEASKLKKEIDEILSKPSDNIRVQVAQEEAVEALRLKLEKTNDQIANFNKKAEDEAKKQANEAKRRTEELKHLDAQRLDDKIRYYEQIGDIEKANSVKLIKYEKELSEAVKRGGITRLEAAAQLEAKRKELSEKGLKDETERIKKQDALYLDYYVSLEKYEEAWQIKRKEHEADYQKLVKEFGKEFADKWLKKKEDDFKKSVARDVKTVKAAFKDIKNSWADTVSSMSKTVDDGFFNFFIGKTKSLKTALKDIGTNLMRDLISPYARTLSQGISGGFGALLGGGSNLASIASNLGLAKNDRGGWDGTIGGTTVELSSTGQILRGADALDKSTTNLLSSISNLKTAYDTFTGSMGSGFANFGNYLSGMGYAGSGQFMSGVGGGISNLFGGNAALAGATSRGAATSAMAFNSASPYYTAGAGLGGGLVGGAAGYGIGTGLDKAFGAQTYAPQTGMAAGAAVGAYAGIYGLAAIPVWGWIAAAVLVAIGGMIGKSKITDWGYQVGQDLSLGLDKGLDGGVNNWKEKTKKSWFSKSVSNQTSPIDEQTQKMLNQYVRTNSVLLKEFTGGDFKLPARTYNKRTLIDEGFGGALIAGVMGKNYDKALSFGGNEGELEKTYRYWMEQAKQDKKETYDLLAEYVGKINSNIKALKLESLNNSLERMKFAKDEAMDALKTLNAGLGAFSGEIEYIGKDMAGQIEKAYREALKNDFSKETVQRYEALTEAYKKAKQAQDEYTKAVLNFTQSIASTQGGFYQALGFDTNFLTLQNLYTRLRNIAGALESDLDDKEKSDVAKIGNSNDPRVWAKYFHDMGSEKLQEFLSTGNVEMRAELVKLAAEYRTFTAANGGRDVWLKSFSDIEAITKQIAALKLAEAAQNTLNLQREQLNLLNKQKSILEKIAQTAQKLRDSVIDSSTSELNYRFALERARIAYAAKDYDSTAYENLNAAVAKQEQYLKQTAGSYAEYKLSILKMASEIEGITGSASLDDINRQIKRLEGLLNSSSNSQLSALEAQKEALIKGANDQINAMELLLGSDSPIVRYLKEALGSLKEGKAPSAFGGNIANVKNGAVTANGATLSSQLDRDINAIYKDVLGRSVEQSGLDAWKRKAQLEGLSKEQIRAQIEATARAITGGNSKQDFIEWSKRQGLKPYAEGGIVTRPTRALIGEAGAEAVIPLKNGAVRAQIVGGDNSELVSLMREGVYLMKEINKNTREGTMVLKDVTNGTEFLVKAV